MNTHQRARAAALLAIPALMLLGACSGASDSHQTGDVAMVEPDGPQDSGAMDKAAGAESRSAEAPAAHSGAATDTLTAPMERHVISTATVSLTSDDVAVARREVQRIADAHRATISDEKAESDADGQTAYARMVLRVPVGEFDAAMQQLEEAGHLVSSTRSSDDVTTEVIDNAVRIRAQRASLKRVEQLLAQADKLQDVVWIESELTNRQAQLDSLLQQQTWLKDQTSLSTITVDIQHTEDAEPTPKDEDEAGFLAGLKDGWKALAATATALATVVGALLPFAVVIAVLGVPVWLLVRKARRRRSGLPA